MFQAGTIIKADSRSEFQDLLNWLSKNQPQLKWVTGNKNTPEYKWWAGFSSNDIAEDTEYILCINSNGTIFFRNKKIDGPTYIDDVRDNCTYENTSLIYSWQVMCSMPTPSKSDLMEFLIGE